jgi:SAM-dependent methyltransferase
VKTTKNYSKNLLKDCDFIVRLLYCRLPFLKKLLFWKLYSSNFKILDDRFEKTKFLLKKLNFSFKDKVCLELGPGNSFINAYNFLMLGAKKVILIDKYPRHTKTKHQKEYLNEELDYIKKKYNKQNLFFIKNGKLNKKYIEFISGDITDSNFIKKFNLNGKFDFVYSIAVLEHIKKVKKAVITLGKITKKNGLMYHVIDLRDHFNFNKPFLFYKYSDRVWNKYLTREGFSYTNRWRYNNYKKLFKDQNLELVGEDKIRFPFNLDKNRKIDDKFKRRTDLNIGVVKFLWKKK